MNQSPTRIAPTEWSEHLTRMKVLVADDSRTLRLVLLRELKALGITQATEAVDGQSAIQLLRQESFDLLLLDMEMPGLDGFEVLKMIKGDAELAHVPVIVISGSEQFERTVECIEIGAEDYLPKPFNSVLLRARVFSALEKKRLSDLSRERMVALQREHELLTVEQLKTEKLMLNILPQPIAERLKRGEKNIASHYSDVTILFSDLVGFTDLANNKSASELVSLLNDLFSRFDRRALELGLEKIKTIGDAYMAVAGLPIPRADHATLCADMALGMFEDLAAFNKQFGLTLNIRIGLHSGPVVAGVIGFTKFSYDLWGSTVNIASRMESTSLVGRIQVSPTVRASLDQTFDFEERELIECKGVGKILTSFLLKKRSRLETENLPNG